jgi:hypothetical protein
MTTGSAVLDPFVHWVQTMPTDDWDGWFSIASFATFSAACLWKASIHRHRFMLTLAFSIFGLWALFSIPVKMHTMNTEYRNLFLQLGMVLYALDAIILRVRLWRMGKSPEGTAWTLWYAARDE